MQNGHWAHDAMADGVSWKIIFEAFRADDAKLRKGEEQSGWRLKQTLLLSKKINAGDFFLFLESANQYQESIEKSRTP